VFGGPLPLAAFPVMIGVHMAVGILEAAISVSVISAVMASRPDLLANRDRFPVQVPARGGEETA
jgi:cobalt/nickel transport system permease protein